MGSARQTSPLPESERAYANTTGNDPADEELFQIAHALWDLGQQYIDDREVDLFMYKYGAPEIECLMMEIYNVSYAEDDLPVPEDCDELDPLSLLE